jgi:RNA polymerase sigma factor (sigma-70 family)
VSDHLHRSVAVEVTGGSGFSHAELFARHWRPLLRLALTLVDDPASAEDVVQDAFAGLVDRADALQSPAAAAAYLRTSVVNGGRSALRRRRTVRQYLSRQRDERTAPPADEPTLRSAEEDAVRRTLAALPRRQREVLGLRLLCDLDDREIAAVTGMSHAHVRSAASRGLAALRASIGESS